MYLTPEQKSALLSVLALAPFPGLTDAEASHALNAVPMVPNPVPQPTVPRAIRATEILALLSPPTIAGIAGLGLLGHLDTLAWNQERSRIRTWVDSFLVPFGKCTEGEADAIGAYLDAADPDPNWSPEVPGTPAWQELFPGVAFESPWSPGAMVVGLCYPEYIAEARS